MALEYWLLGLPLLLIAIFMNTLADIQDEGQFVRLNMIWGSMSVERKNVVRTTRSFLDGIGILQLHRFVPPWGKIYFVTDWSTLGVAAVEDINKADKHTGFMHTTFELVAMAASGFVAAWAMRSSIHDFRIETSNMRIMSIVVAGILCLVFAIARTKSRILANVGIFITATVIAFSIGSAK